MGCMVLPVSPGLTHAPHVGWLGLSLKVTFILKGFKKQTNKKLGGGNIPRRQNGSCQASQGTEIIQPHFLLLLMVKTSHQVSPDSRDRKIDSISDRRSCKQFVAILKQLQPCLAKTNLNFIITLSDHHLVSFQLQALLHGKSRNPSTLLRPPFH